MQSGRRGQIKCVDAHRRASTSVDARLCARLCVCVWCEWALNGRPASVGDSGIRGMKSTLSAYTRSPPRCTDDRRIAFHCSDLAPGPCTQSRWLSLTVDCKEWDDNSLILLGRKTSSGTHYDKTAPGSRVQRIPFAAYITAVSLNWNSDGWYSKSRSKHWTSSVRRRLPRPVIMYLLHVDSSTSTNHGF